MTALAALLHAFAGYFILLLTIRLLTRRPGSQLTLFEFVLIFLMGGIIIASTLGNDRSLTNATCAVIMVGLLHRAVSYARNRWRRIGLLADGIPLVIYKTGDWQIAPEDVLAAARSKGFRSLDEIDYAILERNGQISILSKQAKP
ncbi:MAG: hypothetical protein QOK38_1299 [Acidobacteriaceae bacterium]|jgi:uncharacterized membrane protein YcaP (DUF421 family)|nr:hypothetical protein [Acidobacteriaceae bacterium]